MSLCRDFNASNQNIQIVRNVVAARTTSLKHDMFTLNTCCMLDVIGHQSAKDMYRRDGSTSNAYLE